MCRSSSAWGRPRLPVAFGKRRSPWSATSRKGEPPPARSTRTGAGSSGSSSLSIIDDRRSGLALQRAADALRIGDQAGAARAVEKGDDRPDLGRHAALGELAGGEPGLGLGAGDALEPAL